MNSTALAVIQPDELEVIQRAARMLAVSNYFDGKGDNPQAIAMIATKILAGREMGFGPFASANGIHIIQGRPSVGANLMASAVKSSGRYNYRVKEMTADKCAIEFLEREGDKWVSLGISEFTRADAVAANTKNLTTFPRNMFFARAMSNGVRWYCPDVFSGNAVYVPEELGAEVDSEGNVVSTTYIVTKPEPERQVDTSTGEIVDSLPVATDVIFQHETTPYWVTDWHKLTGKEYDLVKWIATLHDKSDGACTAKQYQYLTGLIDALTNSEHNYILSLLCQSEISADNMPGTKVAKSLIEILPQELRLKDEDGKEVRGVDGKFAKTRNPAYRPDICELITALAQPVATVA